MTEPTRRLLQADFAEVIARLPAIGRLMVVGRTDAVTHERIGPVDTVTPEGEYVRIGGNNHDSLVDPATVKAMVIDTSSVMRDQVYPRIDFNGGDGEPVFSVVGFGGLEPFNTALDGLVSEPLPTTDKTAERKQRPEVADDDAGRQPLEAAQASGEIIRIDFAGKGFSQSWSGTVSKLSLGMGFINVMAEDFHLHLPGGSVARWQQGDNGALSALDAAGVPIGLTVSPQKAKA